MLFQHKKCSYGSNFKSRQKAITKLYLNTEYHENVMWRRIVSHNSDRNTYLEFVLRHKKLLVAGIYNIRVITNHNVKHGRTEFGEDTPTSYYLLHHVANCVSQKRLQLRG